MTMYSSHKAGKEGKMSENQQLMPSFQLCKDMASSHGHKVFEYLRLFLSVGRIELSAILLSLPGSDLSIWSDLNGSAGVKTIPSVILLSIVLFRN